MKLLLGKDTLSEQPVYLTAEGARAVLVCGKRGSGKSYTVGVLVEELLTAGERNIIPIIVDPMGVYHTMVQPNTMQQDELFRWGLSTKSYQVRLLIPGEPHALYDEDVLRVLQERRVEIVPLRLNASDLTPDGWCDLFDADINKPMGIVLFRAVQQLHKKGEAFAIQDIIRTIERDGKASDTSKEALLNRLEAAQSWQLFAENNYTPIHELFQPGIVNVLDLSRLEPGPRGRRNLAVSVIARNLFRARSDARLREEFGLATPMPRVWMLLDEAHQFVPAGSNTLAKGQLIRWAKEGRQPGLSLAVASQQPSAIDPEVLSQCDMILSHKLTSRNDVGALNGLSQDYMGSELRTFIKNLKRTGEAVLVDDELEAVYTLRIRPRRSQHGGGSLPTHEENDFDIWQ
ncbi:MAG: ATP-binding protein [Ardenticatenaceae bacterium]|nr:ATP-binding protein [Anaerolineales bacterium]MCB8918103.1 ATP-binding protein [Ardenticatenaceae bacterium]